MKAVIYARYSSDTQREESIEGQLRECMEYSERNGMAVIREYLGHGIGRDLHEDPQVPNYGKPHTGPHLKEGMVLAIEPMLAQGTYDTKVLSNEWTVVTADGKLSAHYENTVVITDGEPELLTL